LTKNSYSYPRLSKSTTPKLIWERKSLKPLKLPNIKLQSVLSWKPQFDLQKGSNKHPYSHILEFPSSWKNWLILGDSLLAMHALIQQGFENSIQMVYIDPPYGINYKPKSNVNQISTDGYVDTWKNGLGSYLEHLRERLLLIRHLLHPTGSVFLQIGQKNMHYVRCLMDEIFGDENCVNVITFRTAISTNNVLNIADHLLWYAKDKSKVFQRNLFVDRPYEKQVKTFTYTDGIQKYKPQELVIRRKKAKVKSKPQINAKSNVKSKIKSQKTAQRATRLFSVEFQGKSFIPPEGFEWRWDRDALNQLKKENRLAEINGKLYGKRYESDFPYMILTNVWMDTSTSTFAARKHYAVHTNPKVIWRCMAITTRPGDLILDPTLGSGTSVVVAEKYGRRWIGIDSNPASIRSSLSWLFEKPFPIFKKDENTNEFQYQKFEKISLSNIANARVSSNDFLYDRPIKAGKLIRFPQYFELLVNITNSLGDSSKNETITMDSLPFAIDIKAILESVSIPNRNGELSSIMKVVPINPALDCDLNVIPLKSYEYYEIHTASSIFLAISVPFLVPIDELELINHINQFFSENSMSYESLILLISLGQLSWGVYSQFYKKFGPSSPLFNRLRLGYFHPILSVPHINIRYRSNNTNIVSFNSWIEFSHRISADLIDEKESLFWAIFPYDLSDQYLSHQVKTALIFPLGKKYIMGNLSCFQKSIANRLNASTFSEIERIFSEFSAKISDNKFHLCIWDSKGCIHYGFFEPHE